MGQSDGEVETKSAGTMTTFAAITSLVVWFLVRTCRSNIANVNHDGRHLNMISEAKVNTSSIHAYLNLKTPLLGSGGGQGSSSHGGGQGGSFDGSGNRELQDSLLPKVICPTLNVNDADDNESKLNGLYKFTWDKLDKAAPDKPVFKHVFRKKYYIYYVNHTENVGWRIGDPFTKGVGVKSYHKNGDDDWEPWQTNWFGQLSVECVVRTECEDRDPELCENINKEDCKKSEVVKYFCKKKCDRCAECEDERPACKNIKQDDCENDEHGVFKSLCKNACGLCPDCKGLNSKDLKWERWGDTCYAYIEQIMDWKEAKDYCKKILKGSSKWKTGLVAPYKKEFLVMLADKYALNNDFTTYNKIFLTPDGKATRNSGPWIGGTDNKTEGIWEWAEPFQERDFLRKEIPNGDSFADNQGPNGDEDCLEIFNKKGDVNDMQCDLWKLTFICGATRELKKDEPWHSDFPIGK